MKYRSYYYDEEVDMYYLQSRYYWLPLCRFLNADLPEYAKIQRDETAGTNLFAYCNNDPVNNADFTGFSKSKLSAKVKKKVNELIKKLSNKVKALIKLISRIRIDNKYVYIYIKRKEIKNVSSNLEACAIIFGMIATCAGTTFIVSVALIAPSGGASSVVTLIDAVFAGTSTEIAAYLELMSNRLDYHNNGKNIIIRIRKKGFGKFTFKIIEGWS